MTSFDSKSFYTGAVSEGGALGATPPPSRNREKEGRKYVYQGGTPADPVEAVLISYLFIFRQ